MKMVQAKVLNRTEFYNFENKNKYGTANTFMKSNNNIPAFREIK